VEFLQSVFATLIRHQLNIALFTKKTRWEWIVIQFMQRIVNEERQVQDVLALLLYRSYRSITQENRRNRLVTKLKKVRVHATGQNRLSMVELASIYPTTSRIISGFSISLVSSLGVVLNKWIQIFKVGNDLDIQEFLSTTRFLFCFWYRKLTPTQLKRRVDNCIIRFTQCCYIREWVLYFSYFLGIIW